MKIDTEIHACWFLTIWWTHYQHSGLYQGISKTSSSLGAQCFLAQLNVQRADLLERLSTAHNFCNLDDEDNYIAASKAVRQVRENSS